MLTKGDFVHFHGSGNGICRGAAHELHNGRGSRHGKTAKTGCFCDGAVADIGVGVLFAETGEVQALHNAGGGGEPAFWHGRDANAKISAVAGHDGDNGAAFNALSGFHSGFTGRHGEVQEEMVVLVDEFNDFGQFLVVLAGAGQGGGDGT
ncbi:hypothetical protein SDC9_108219 [bioreactor metagenome]|uniref:Uncharacterized protein n=1 Tax=bioreactor metagenome TaxID=1076179 RepID=A0A645B9P1_9ZZZZ